ncbi:MAG: hypothetical protein EBT18_12660 [Gammaproteobacteria bacterium]|nr:hypothetical protein [Gammaproteobacteria bacterium]
MHTFDPKVAEEVGVPAAVILFNLGYLQSQRALQGGEEYFAEGRWWVRHSYESLAKWHSYFSVPQIKRIMRGLIDENHVVKRHRPGFDRTTYWSVSPEFLHVSESTDGSEESVPSDSTKSTDVLHDNNNKPISSRCDSDSDFDNWWESYPKKTGKQKARIRFRNLSRSDREAMLADDLVKRYGHREKKYIKGADAYLNERRWEDDYDNHFDRSPGDDDYRGITL